MANAFDVAKYILNKKGEITAMKLQKLVYYSQAWHLVWKESPLFSERIEAWANGAVIRDLYFAHKGMFTVDENSFAKGNINHLSDDEKATIDKVLEFYGGYTAQQLSDINHQEAPWINARGKLPPMAPCEKEITKDEIFEYHFGIWNTPEE